MITFIVYLLSKCNGQSYKLVVCKFIFQACLEFSRSAIGDRRMTGGGVDAGAAIGVRGRWQSRHTGCSCGDRALFSSDLCIGIGYLISSDANFFCLEKKPENNWLSWLSCVCLYGSTSLLSVPSSGPLEIVYINGLSAFWLLGGWEETEGREKSEARLFSPLACCLQINSGNFKFGVKINYLSHVERTIHCVLIQLWLIWIKIYFSHILKILQSGSCWQWYFSGSVMSS